MKDWIASGMALKGKTMHFDKNLSQLHFFNDKSHDNLAGIKYETPKIRGRRIVA
jgi:hypothetical protein